MKEIVPNVHLLQSLRRSNVYLLVSSEGLSLVDSGLPGGSETIASELEQGGFSLSDVRMIVLTHAHPDHTGNAPDLARRSGVHVWAHEAAVPFIEQTQPLPAASPLQRVMVWLSDRLLYWNLQSESRLA
jgi:glyoxylase-like metal-dependent hydrolase (beta-lactamase superfamily II)